jgi:hypothetical protein
LTGNQEGNLQNFVPSNFGKNILRIGDFEKLNASELAILDFFFKKNVLLHTNENQSKVHGYQGWDETLTITLVSTQKSPTPNISAPSVCMKLKCQKQSTSLHDVMMLLSMLTGRRACGFQNLVRTPV